MRHNSATEERPELTWLCTYTPLEIIASAGLCPRRFTGRGDSFAPPDPYLHSTLCSYARSCYQGLLRLQNSSRGVVLVNSCHAMVHLFHALERKGVFSFLHLLDLPRETSRRARHRFSNQLRGFHRKLQDHFGIKDTQADLWEQINLYEENRRLLQGVYEEQKKAAYGQGDRLLTLVENFTTLSGGEFNKEARGLWMSGTGSSHQTNLTRAGPRLLLTGSMVPRALPALIGELGGTLVLDDLCRGRKAVFFPYEARPESEEETEDPYDYLSALYLNKTPCARMSAAARNLQEMKTTVRAYRLDGVIFFCLKFCDPWRYHGQLLKEQLQEVPVLFLEGEYASAGVPSQLHTRIAAFIEMLS